MVKYFSTFLNKYTIIISVLQLKQKVDITLNYI